MLQIGTLVKIKEPFNESFPKIYNIIDIIYSEDNTVAYILNDGVEGFDEKFLEVVE